MTALTGVILAGGQGRRMGGQDKGLVLFRGIPLYQHVLQRLRPQVDIVMISANRNLDRYQSSGCRVISDTLSGTAGGHAERPASRANGMGGLLFLRHALRAH